MKGLVLCSIAICIFLSFESFAKCSLSPKNLTFTDDKFSSVYDKNVEREINKYYLREYNEFVQYYKQAKKAHKNVASFKRKIKALNIKLSATISKIERKKKDPSTSSKVLKIKATLSEYNEYLNIFKTQEHEMRAFMKRLHDPLITQMDISELEVTPDNRVVGHFSIEGFLRPSAGSVLSLPMGVARFNVSEKSIIYLCVNFDKFNAEKNHVTLRFLKTNRNQPKNISEYILNPYGNLSRIKNIFTRPKVRIDPSNITAHIADAVVTPIDAIFAHLAPLRFVTYILHSIGKTVDYALKDIILDNVGIGAKSLTISNDHIRMQFGVKTLFGLVKFNNIFEYTSEGDYSIGLNKFTLNPYDEHYARNNTAVE